MERCNPKTLETVLSTSNMGKPRPTGQMRPADPFIWPTGTYINLNSHRALSGRPFFPLEIMDGSDFQKNKPWRCKIGIKNEVKTFYFGRSHSYVDRDLQKKKKKRTSLVFQSACGPRLQQFFQIWPFDWKACPPLLYMKLWTFLQKDRGGGLAEINSRTASDYPVGASRIYQ